MKRRDMLKVLGLGAGAALASGALVWLWQRSMDNRRQMAGRLGLSPTERNVIEDGPEPARPLARRWQRLLADGRLYDLPATLWQRFWYDKQSDSRPYMRASFCVLALERASAAPDATEMVIEPRDVAQVMPRFSSRWPALRPEISIDPRWQISSADPSAARLILSDDVAADLNERLSAFADRFACDDPLRHMPDWRPAALGWFELEARRATYTTFGEPDVACAERMLCALSVLTRLARL